MSDTAHRVRSLHLTSWRNVTDATLEAGPGVNVLSGDNGEGKTNWLEAIRLAATGASFRGAGTDELIQRGAERGSLRAVVDGSPLAHTIEVHAPRGGTRSIQLDGKRPRSLLALAQALPTVLFHPGDLVLAQGGPEGRRRLLDMVLCELDGTYAQALQAYGKALRSRNHVLKSESPERRAITAYDPLLAESGAVVGRSRATLVEALAPRAEAIFASLFDELPLRVMFAPRVEPTVAALREALARSFAKDCARGFTAEGPHADEVTLSVAASSAKHHASQGQQRSIVLALKLAELAVLTDATGKRPVFLLDDVTSELDRTRNRLLFEHITSCGGQVFLTTTRAEWIALEGSRRDHFVHRGRLRERGNDVG